MPKSLCVVREAVDVLLRRLRCVPPSEKADELHGWLRDCLEEAEQWCASPPTHEEHDELSKRVLALHVAVTKLERDARLAAAIAVSPARDRAVVGGADFPIP